MSQFDVTSPSRPAKTLRAEEILTLIHQKLENPHLSSHQFKQEVARLLSLGSEVWHSAPIPVGRSSDQFGDH